MMKTSRGLGKGIDALFRNNEHAPAGLQARNKVSIVPLASLVPNPSQPRKHFAPDALEELAASIRSQGLVQPLLVRPAGNAQYEIVAGERRWRAAKIAGLTEIPVLVRELSDMELMAAALIENLQREDLTPLEEASAMATLRDQFGLSQDELASTLGKSRPAVANALRLLNLNAEARTALEQGHISAGHARAVLSLGNPDAQSELVQACMQKALSVRDAEYAANLWKEEGVFPWHVEGEEPPDIREQRLAMSENNVSPGPHRKLKSPYLHGLQQRLRQDLRIHANITGTETRGRISVAYQTREELLAVLQRLGLDARETAPEG